jgi:hypothetical protein
VHTTRADLVRLYGASNVVDQEVDTGEGEMQSETVVFPKDPERQVYIMWNDPGTKTSPQSADLLGTKSRWHAVHGITLGTSINELERLNGRPFRFALINDGTDMAEETISWQGGLLENDFQGNGRIILEIEGRPAQASKPTGPHDFETESNNRNWRAQNPHISRMTWMFPSDTSKTQP